ncbi:MAG: WYL domain-containing protein [Candidatus Binatia bacterium]|nr:WYL domain-containing protein [Candidatus Binatia bacterium]
MPSIGSAAAWVRGNIWHESRSVTELRDGHLRMCLRVADTPELVGWILHFGGGVCVVQPEALREKVRAEARKIVEQE